MRKRRLGRFTPPLLCLSFLLAGASLAWAQADMGATGLVVVEDMVAKERYPGCPQPQTEYDPWTGAVHYTCPTAQGAKKPLRPARND